MGTSRVALMCGAALFLSAQPSYWCGPCLRAQTPQGAQAAQLTTFAYKRVGELEIKADVWRAPDTLPRPTIIWIHGGALINGHRGGINNRVKKMALDAGYVVVSIDYRLAPESKLPEIIEDLEDAIRWVHEQGPELFHADTSRVAVMGGSAGGYLTLTAGYRAKPRPDVLVAFWGYGDLIGEWYSTPSPHRRHNFVKPTKEEAFAQVGKSPISDARQRQGNGGLFYTYCRQHGIWPQQVSTWDPATEANKFDEYMPVENVSAEYPPTLLIHGTVDTDVPFKQSEMMVEQFSEHKVPHRLIAIKNGEHGLGGADPDEIDQAYAAVMEFLDAHLKPAEKP